MLSLFSLCFFMRTPASAPSDNAPSDRGATQGEIHELPALLSGEARIAEHHFTIKNTLARDITITRVNKSCSCTSVELERNTLRPGETSALKMVVDLRGRTGPFSTECVVHHDAGEPWRYRLKCQIYPEVEFDVPMIRLGDISPGSTKVARFKVSISSRGSMPPIPEIKVLGSGNHLAYDVRGGTAETIKNGLFRRHFAARLHLESAGLSGVGDSRICFSDNAGHSADLGVTWRAVEYIDVQPKRVFFAKPDSEVKQNVLVRLINGSPFRVARIECSSVDVRCSSSRDGTSSEHVLTIEIDPTSFDHFLAAKVLVQTEAANGMMSRTEIPLSAAR
ncbi:MAG: DUF1573 domain-containing protein [Planctomycetota bacterium]